MPEGTSTAETQRDVKPDSKPMLNLTRGTMVCEHAMVADRPLRRMRGLLGRRSLPGGEGLLLRPAPSVHTAFMRFPIDVVFLDRELEVVKVVENLRPWRMASARQARAALELAAGQAATRRLEVGDRLRLVTIPTGTEAADVGGACARPQPLVELNGAADPIHVLLVGKDRRFWSKTSALLIRRGCIVTVGERLDLASTCARHASPDVVVIDGYSYPAEAVRKAAEIQTIEPSIGVVLLGEERSGAAPPAPVVPKLGTFDDLYAAIKSVRPSRNRMNSNGGC
jgi:uncharacterized protein